MAVTWSVGGGTLAGTLPVLVAGVPVNVELDLLVGTTWRPPVTARNVVVEVPGRNGSIPSSGITTYESPTVTLVGEVVAPSEAALEAALSYVEALFVRPGGVALTRTVGASSVSAHARVLSWVQDAEASTEPTGLSWSEWTAVLTVPDVFFRDGNLTPWVYAWGTGTLSAQAAPHLAASTAPVVDAVVRILGPVTNPSVTDVASGTSLLWSGSVPAGTYLYLDARTLTARTSTSSTAWASGGTNVTSTLSYGVAGPLQLWPRPSVNPAVREVLITAAGTGRTTATQIAIRAEGSYL